MFAPPKLTLLTVYKKLREIASMSGASVSVVMWYHIPGTLGGDFNLAVWQIWL